MEERIAVTVDGSFIYPYNGYLFPDSGVALEYSDVLECYLTYLSLGEDGDAWPLFSYN